MSKQYIWRPKEFSTGPVEGLDIAFPVGIGSDMYYYAGDDEAGNALFDQVGTIKFPDPSNKKVYEVTYYREYDGPREYESQESKDERAEYEREVEQRANEESTAPDTESAGDGDSSGGSDNPVSEGSAGESTDTAEG